MAGQAVIFEVGADASSFDKTMAGLEAQTSKAAASVDASFTRSFDKLASTASSAGNAISIGVTAPLVAVGALAGNTAVKFTKLYETTMIVFESMLGGKEAASALYSSLLDIAKGSTYAQETFLECGKKLVGMGVDADTTKSILQATTDAVAGFGGSSENIKAVTDAFAKMSNSGRLSMEEVNTLSDNGVQALKILANQYGVSTDEMRAMISEGAVPAKDAIEKLTSGIEDGTDGAAGMTEAMGGMAASLKAGTLTGAFDGINSAVRTFSLRLIGINPTLKETDEGYAESEERIRQLTAAVVEISEIIPLLAKVFSGVTDAVGRVLDALVGTNVKLDESAGKWTEVNGALGDFKRYLRDTPTEQLAMIGNLLVAIAVTGPALKAVSVAMGLLQGATELASAAAGVGAGLHAAYTAALEAHAVACAADAAALAPLNAMIAANPVGATIVAFVGLTAALGAATFALNDFIGGEDKLTTSSQAQKDKVGELTAEYYGLMLSQGETADATIAAKAALDEEKAVFEASKETIGQFVTKCRDTVAAHDELAASAEKASATADKQAGSVLSLSRQVAELAGIENRSASQKGLLAAKVNALNDAYGEEVVSYDETTDAASMTAEAIQALGKAEADRVRASAAMDNYAKLMQDSIGISDDLAKAQAELDAETQHNVGSYGTLAGVQWYTSQNQIDLENTVRSLTEAQNENAEDLADAQARIEEYATRQGAVADAVKEVEAKTLTAEEAARKYSEATGLEITASEIMEGQTLKVAEAQQEMSKEAKKAAEELENLTEDLQQYVDETPGFAAVLETNGYSVDTFAKKLQDCGLSVDDLRKTVEEYAEGATNAFEKIELESDFSLDSMLETMKFNAEATQSWADNVTALYARAGNDSERAFIKSIADMGVEYAPAIQLLLDASEEKLAELAGVYGTGTAAAKDAAWAELILARDGAIAAAGETVDGVAAEFAEGAAPAGESGAGTGSAYAESLETAIASCPVEVQGYVAQLQSDLEAFQGRAAQIGSDTGTGYGSGAAEGVSLQVGAVGDASNALAASLQNPLSPTPAFARKMAEDFGAEVAGGINGSVGGVAAASGNVEAAATIGPGRVDNSPGGASSAESFADGQDASAGTVAASSDEISKLAADHMSSASADARQAGASMAGEHFANGVSGGRDAASAEARSLSKLVADHMSSASGDAWWAGYNMVAGMAEGISAGRSAAVNAAADAASAAVSAAKAALDEHSPSRVMREVGKYFSEGYAVGIDDGAGKAVDAARDAAERSVEAARRGSPALSFGLDAAALDAFQRKRELAVALAAPSPAPGSSADAQAIMRELGLVRESIEGFRKGIGRTIRESAPTKVDAYVENPRAIARAMDGR